MRTPKDRSGFSPYLDFFVQADPRVPQVSLLRPGKLGKYSPSPVWSCEPVLRQPQTPSVQSLKAMKLLLIILIAVVVLGSLIADYKWRQWMAERKRERE